MPAPKRQRFKINQRWLRRRKNLSFAQLGAGDKKAIEQQERAHSIRTARDFGTLADQSGLDFQKVIAEVKNRFPGETLEMLDEGGGENTYALSLRITSGQKLHVVKTDIPGGFTFGSAVESNVNYLVKNLGKNRFHLALSIAGGLRYTPLVEKAFFQFVSVIKPGGIGVVFGNTKLAVTIKKLANRFNITILPYPNRYNIYSPFPATTEQYFVVFTKNIGRKKK